MHISIKMAMKTNKETQIYKVTDDTKHQFTSRWGKNPLFYHGKNRLSDCLYLIHVLFFKAEQNQIENWWKDSYPNFYSVSVSEICRIYISKLQPGSHKSDGKILFSYTRNPIVIPLLTQLHPTKS